MSSERVIVAGVDGSPESLAAVQWAAQDAARRGCALRIVHAFVWPALYAPVMVAVPDEPGWRRAAEEMVAEAAAGAVAVAPGLEVSTDVQVQPPAAALVAASERACTVVVGNRGLGGFTGLLLGSVGVQLAAHAACPVVIFRRADRPAGHEAGRVVVGVDDPHEATHALRFAFEQASYRGAGLTAVHAYQWPAVIGPIDVLPLAYDPDDLRAEERRTLVRSMSEWAGKYPGVDLRHTVVQGRAGAVLTELSAGAQLLVVGSRGRGGFTGLLLGSVSQAVIHHAGCPVAVVR
ncbi:universal stress protein [Dactylosporangium sp. NPDC051485]|uniref:universal stress protein n=1 Tax=Dactylosporangium sp. NPDC051485 TaxID=3154846 RepID=UPI0034471871